MSEGTGLGGAYSNIIIASPREVVTETYQEQGEFNSKELAIFHAKYIMTKFARALLYLNKHSQHSTTSWGAVPQQNFSELWWNESIDEIDVRLMDKYSIPNNIRAYILDNVQQKSENNILNFKV